MNEDIHNLKELLRRQVSWYRENGRFPHRIKIDSDGSEFVEGDWSWNRRLNIYDKCPHCGKPMSSAFEEIEGKMLSDVLFGGDEITRNAYEKENEK